MNSRLRSFAALIALLTFSVSFAEGLWASMCPPGMDMEGMEEVLEREETHPPAGMKHSSTDASDTDASNADASSTDASDSSRPADPTDDPRQAEEPVCPLGPVGLGGSCVTASLPAPSVGVEPLLSESVTLSLSPVAVRDLLLTDALFHPPRK